MKNFGEKGVRAYPGTAKIFWVPPIISGMGKATDFTFGQHIQRVHPNKSPLKNLEKRERGHIEVLPKCFGYPLLSQERGKLQISNLASTFRGAMRIKAHEKFWRKGSVCVSRDCPIFFPVPPIISGTGKATDFKFCMHIYRLNRNKSALKFGRSSRGRCPGFLKIFRAPMHRAHRAVIFVIAQLSCY